jgi:hypothetical protein
MFQNRSIELNPKKIKHVLFKGKRINWQYSNKNLITLSS